MYYAAYYGTLVIVGIILFVYGYKNKLFNGMNQIYRHPIYYTLVFAEIQNIVYAAILYTKKISIVSNYARTGDIILWVTRIMVFAVLLTLYYVKRERKA